MGQGGMNREEKMSDITTTAGIQIRICQYCGNYHNYSEQMCRDTINRPHFFQDWKPEKVDPQMNRYKKALEEIAKGEGAFSRDHLTHAQNTIENMKRIAVEALEG
jgi:hypothetical protein